MAPTATLPSRLAAAWRAARAAWQAPDATASPALGPAAAPRPPHDATLDSTIGPAPSAAPSLSDLLAHSPDIVVHLDAQGRVAGGNARATQCLLGPAAAPASLRRLAAPGEWRRWARDVRPTLALRGVWAGETTLRLDGQRRPFALVALARRDAAGRLAGCTAVLRELGTDDAAHRQIQRQNQILSAITEALPATVVIVDSRGRYRYVNSAFERYVGRPAASVLGRSAEEVLGAEEVARRRPFMQQALAGEPVEFVLDYATAEGTAWLALSCIPIQLDGVFDGFVGISQDITMQRREHERLAHLAERDPLTGLLNRAGFEQRVARQRAQGEGTELALLYIDLDHFKTVNDTLGHAAGDQLLQQFARRLLRAVRSTDVVARLGGDEFAILLTGVCDHDSARAVADKVLAAASRAFDLDGRARTVGASVGVAVLPRAHATLAELLHQADLRLYRAKAAGRGRHCSDADAGAGSETGPHTGAHAREVNGADTGADIRGTAARPDAPAVAAPPRSVAAAGLAQAARPAARASAPLPQRAPPMPGAPGTPVAAPAATRPPQAAEPTTAAAPPA